MRKIYPYDKKECIKYLVRGVLCSSAFGTTKENEIGPTVFFASLAVLVVAVEWTSSAGDDCTFGN